MKKHPLERVRYYIRKVKQYNQRMWPEMSVRRRKRYERLIKYKMAMRPEIIGYLNSWNHDVCIEDMTFEGQPIPDLVKPGSARVIHISSVPTWQRQAVLADWVQWVVVRGGYIDGGFRTRAEADQAAGK